MVYINLLSLFSGIGAFERSLTNIGIDYNLIAYSEINKYASTAYSAIHNVSEDKNLGDVSKIDFTQFDNVDMITHGSPCTSFSISGKQKGGDEGSGTKSSLMWHTVDAIDKTNPKYVIWENVDNVLSNRHKHNFNKYLDRLKELGYKNYSKVINAKYWGVPQNRKRIFVVSIRKDIDNGFNFPISSLESNGQTSLFNDSLIDIEPKVLKDILQNEVDEKYYLNIEVDLNKSDNILTAAFRGRYNKDGEINQNLEVKDEQTTNALTNVQKDNVLLENIVCEQRCDEGLRFFKDNICGTLRTIDSGGDKRVLEKEDAYYHIRKLTPLECFRLMGFKDKDYWRARNVLETTYYNGRDRSDSQMYKMSGNSIVVNVLEYIFKELLF